MARTKMYARHKDSLSRKGKKASQPLGNSQKKRFRPGTICLREIKKYQKSTDLLIRKLPFQRMVKDFTYQFDTKFRWSARGILCAQAAVEDFVVNLMQDGVLCMLHGKRVTLMAKDLILARRIRGSVSTFL